LGVEWACVPSRATHLMFLPVLGSNESGRPFSAETMLRDQAWPHCGWSAEAHGKVQLATSAQHSGRLNVFLTAHRYHEPTPNPSQEGNCHCASAVLLPSWEGLRVGCFMEWLEGDSAAFIVTTHRETQPTQFNKKSSRHRSRQLQLLGRGKVVSRVGSGRVRGVSESRAPQLFQNGLTLLLQFFFHPLRAVAVTTCPRLGAVVG